MSDSAAGLLQIAGLVGLLAAVYVPLGDYMARVYTGVSHLRVEQLIYRFTGVSPGEGQSPRAYALSVVGFSLVSVVVLMGILVGQGAPAPRTGPRGHGVLDVVQHRGVVRGEHELAVLRAGSRRWASRRRWPGWRCRTSCPRRWAWP